MKVISTERVINAIKKYGNGTQIFFPKEYHTYNDWCAWAEGVRLSPMGQPMVWCYIQGGSTDSDDFVRFSDFFKDGDGIFYEDYHGWRYRFNQEQKQEFANNIAKYIEKLENGLGDKQKTIERLLDWAGLINPIVNEYYRNYRLRWASGDDPKYKAYKEAETVLVAHIKQDWESLSKLSKEQLSADYRKVFASEFDRLLNA